MARFSAPLPVVTLASLALVLSACGGGQSGADSQVSETSVVPLAGTSSASASSSASESVAPSAQTVESPVPSSSVPVALPTLASGKTVEFTPEELAAYQRGEYVPASEKHPAYNVPVPVMPEVAKTQTAEGAVAFVEYWRDCLNYAIQTGDTTYFKAINDEIRMGVFDSLANDLEGVFDESYWISGGLYTVDPIGDGKEFNISSENNVLVNYTHAPALLISPDLLVTEEVDGDGAPEPVYISVQWEKDQWVAVGMKGLE